MIEFTAQRYIDDVLAGRLVVCKWVRLAVERHVRDLETGALRGLHFDEDAAKLVIAFFPTLLRHSKGEWAGQPVELEPWQQFHLWTLFGWKRTDGSRRFNESYLEIARKNGKSLMASGVGLYMLASDGEYGAEVFTTATKFDQARIVHEEAVRMVKQSTDLQRDLRLFKNNINYPQMFGKYEPLGADSKTLDGLNVSCCLNDEVHAHPTRDLYDVIKTAMGSRRQPLMYNITTAGYNRQSVCYELHDYTQKVLEGLIEDDSFCGMIFALDEGDDWEDETLWVKANPNLGVSKKLEKMREEAAKAKAMPSALNSFLRLHLDEWTQSEVRWISPDRWKLCGQIALDEAMLESRECYAGLDMASTTDVAAMVLDFPVGDVHYWLARFWIPKENIIERVRHDRVPYDAWVREGFIRATDGNMIDYQLIVRDIMALRERFNIQEIAFDRWGAFQISQFLAEAGIVMVPFGQGFASMSAPSKELEGLVADGRLAHGNNPVLAWMANNVVIRMDPAGNIKPDKSRSIEKVDGIVAGVMALDRAIRHEGSQADSVYETRGVISL